MAKARSVAKDSRAARPTSQPTIPRELVDAIEAAIEIEHAAEDRRKRGKRSHLAHSLHRALADFSEREALEIVGRILQMRHPDARDPWAAEFPDCPVDRPVAFV